MLIESSAYEVRGDFSEFERFRYDEIDEESFRAFEDELNNDSTMIESNFDAAPSSSSEMASSSLEIATSETAPIVIPPCFFTCSATAKDSVVAMKDSENIRRKWDAVSPPETPSEILVGETLALVVVCVLGLALNLCAFYIGRKNGLKKTRIYMKVGRNKLNTDSDA